MVRIFLVAVSLTICSVAAAQVLTLAEVKAKGGVQLSADDLKQLMPGAKVVSRTNSGSTRYWQNAADGAFVASSDNRGGSMSKPYPASGPGTWRLADNGSYCVNIKWPMTTENWCSYIFKAGDKYYGVRRLEANAPASELEISR